MQKFINTLNFKQQLWEHCLLFYILTAHGMTGFNLKYSTAVANCHSNEFQLSLELPTLTALISPQTFHFKQTLLSSFYSFTALLHTDRTLSCFKQESKALQNVKAFQEVFDKTDKLLHTRLQPVTWHQLISVALHRTSDFTSNGVLALLRRKYFVAINEKSATFKALARPSVGKCCCEAVRQLLVRQCLPASLATAN